MWLEMHALGIPLQRNLSTRIDDSPMDLEVDSAVDELQCRLPTFHVDAMDRNIGPAELSQPARVEPVIALQNHDMIGDEKLVCREAISPLGGGPPAQRLHVVYGDAAGVEQGRDDPDDVAQIVQIRPVRHLSANDRATRCRGDGGGDRAGMALEFVTLMTRPTSERLRAGDEANLDSSGNVPNTMARAAQLEREGIGKAAMDFVPVQGRTAAGHEALSRPRGHRLGFIP